MRFSLEDFVWICYTLGQFATDSTERVVRHAEARGLQVIRRPPEGGAPGPTIPTGGNTPTPS